jgi:hypothetical protein
MSTIDNSISPASATNIGRHPIVGSNHCTGNVEVTMPSDPVISIQALLRVWMAGANQRR